MRLVLATLLLAVLAAGLLHVLRVLLLTNPLCRRLSARLAWR